MTLSRCVELLRKAKRKTLNKIRVNVKDYVVINAKRNMRDLKGKSTLFKRQRKAAGSPKKSG